MKRSSGRGAAHRAAWSALGINLALMVGKGVIGFLFHSQALIADSAHSLGDAVGSFAVVYGVQVAERPPDSHHRYGHAKAESLAGLAVGVILAVVGVAAAATALGTLLGPQGLAWLADGGATAAGAAGSAYGAYSFLSVPGWPTFFMATLALLVKEGLYRWNATLGKRLHSPALLANASDHRSDEWTSLAAMAGIFAARLGWPLGDPLAAVVVAGLVTVYAGQVIASNVNSLLDLEAEPGTRNLIRDTALSVPGVRAVQRMRTRRSGPFVHVDMEVGADGSLSLVDADRLAHAVMDAIGTIDVIQDVVVHVNPV